MSIMDRQGKSYILASMSNRISRFVAGALETLVLDMSTLVLSVLTSVGQKNPLASEVTAICLCIYFKKETIFFVIYVCLF